MGLRLLCILVGITGFFSAARADILTLRQDLVAPGSTDRTEVTTFLAESDEDRREIVGRLKQGLADDLAKNPDLLTGFEEVVDRFAGRNPSAAVKGTREVIEEVAAGRTINRRVLPETVRKALRIRYPEWFVRHSPMIFSVSRGVINGSIATWSLMVTQHLPFPIAVAAGVLTGAISGRLQYINEQMQSYLTKSILEKYIKQKTLAKGVKFVESTFRWYILEVGFVTTIQLALTAMGHPPAGAILHDVGKTLVTALAAVGGQGLWDIAVSRATKRDLGLAKTAAERLVIRFRSDFITLGLSALAVTGMIGKISGLAFGNTVFWGMGVTGGAYLVKVLHREWKCRQLLGRPPPPEPADPLTAPPAVGEDESVVYAFPESTTRTVRRTPSSTRGIPSDESSLRSARKISATPHPVLPEFSTLIA